MPGYYCLKPIRYWIETTQMIHVKILTPKYLYTFESIPWHKCSNVYLINYINNSQKSGLSKLELGIVRIRLGLVVEPWWFIKVQTWIEITWEGNKVWDSCTTLMGISCRLVNLMSFMLWSEHRKIKWPRYNKRWKLLTCFTNSLFKKYNSISFKETRPEVHNIGGTPWICQCLIEINTSAEC